MSQRLWPWTRSCKCLYNLLNLVCYLSICGEWDLSGVVLIS
jgi:hypothetical protein